MKINTALPRFDDHTHACSLVSPTRLHLSLRATKGNDSAVHAKGSDRAPAVVGESAVAGASTGTACPAVPPSCSWRRLSALRPGQSSASPSALTRCFAPHARLLAVAPPHTSHVHRRLPRHERSLLQHSSPLVSYAPLAADPGECTGRSRQVGTALAPPWGSREDGVTPTHENPFAVSKIFSLRLRRSATSRLTALTCHCNCVLQLSCCEEMGGKQGVSAKGRAVTFWFWDDATTITALRLRNDSIWGKR